MKKLAILLAALLLFTGCGSAKTNGALPELSNPEDLEQLTPSRFGCFTETYETAVSQYDLLEGTELELSVTLLEGTAEGPTVYIVGGVHGDEPAGWYAGELLKKTTLQAGRVYILSPVNRYGADHDRRTTRSDRDINRSFPGDPAGNDAQQIACAVFQDISQKKPDLVLDLHEARNHGENRDDLGNSLICLDVATVDELVFALLGETELASGPLDLFGSPPEGSLNAEVSRTLCIPVLTLETPRAEPLAVRVRTQLRVTEYVLQWYAMRSRG